MVRNQQKRKKRKRSHFGVCFLLFLTGFFLWPVYSDTIEQKLNEIQVSFSLSRMQAAAEERIKGLFAAKSNAEEKKAEQYLILINKEHGLDKDYKPDDLETVKSSAASESSTKMRKVPAEALRKLKAAAKKKGHNIQLISGYRSYDLQKSLFAAYTNRDGKLAEQYSAPPGHSEHQSGLAADVSSPSVNYKLTQAFGSSEEGKWLAANAHKYGFIIRYPDGKEDVTGYMYEPWHLRYVGREAAEEIYSQAITLEEYLDAE